MLGHSALLALLRRMQITETHLQVMLLLLRHVLVAVDQPSGGGREGCKSTPSMGIAVWLSAWVRIPASPLPSSHKYCNSWLLCSLHSEHCSAKCKKVQSLHSVQTALSEHKVCKIVSGRLRYLHCTKCRVFKMRLYSDLSWSFLACQFVSCPIVP